ncbi:hypothetical protein DFH07DRAFT_842864 [Mycena maculata]|uniref:BTB domain-containing protein n=1 Tax=Mycena maculata TaxID=230809 RepID=A0AAD7I726_9AGAR|nr:hypothetical protein DFH07DRAFT_842864 [Mycena maculata]
MSENDSLQRAESLWFSPEIVVLRANTRVFRVFAAILKAQSSVFADMFTFPQPPSADLEMMDGFPVVKLYDDPDEVEVFLKAIFDSSFFMPPPAETHFEDAIGILRLSHKYDVPYLRRRALEHLSTIYPTRLEGYDNRADNTESTQVDFHRRIITIQLAAEVGSLWILPLAYHDLCRREILDIITSVEWQALGEKERNACLAGHSARTSYFPKLYRFLTVHKADEDECDDWSECNRLRLEFSHDVVQWVNTTWPLDNWNNQDWTAMEETGICETCIADSKAVYAASRQTFWDQLPQMFRLPGWEGLEEMRRVALSVF